MRQYTIPYVVERRAGSERTVDVFSRLLSERIVYLGTEIDDGVANVLVAQLLHLESEDPDKPIQLYVNSPGGSTSAMLAVYDAMQYVRPPVATTCVGQAASTAAVLLAGGTAGQPRQAARATTSGPQADAPTGPAPTTDDDPRCDVRCSTRTGARRCSSSLPSASARSASVTPSAPVSAASTSDDGSFSPRSTSERYCGESRARSATSARRSP